jgi:hypothetical protein
MLIFQFGKKPVKPFYLRISPNPGFQIPWFGGKVIHWCRHNCHLQIKRPMDFHRTKIKR